MNNPYEIHSLSRLHREEMLREAASLRLTERARAERNPPRPRSARPAWRSVLALLIRRARFTG